MNQQNFYKSNANLEKWKIENDTNPNEYPQPLYVNKMNL